MFEVFVDKNSKPVKVLCAGTDVTENVLAHGFKVVMDELECIATMSVNCVVRSIQECK